MGNPLLMLNSPPWRVGDRRLRRVPVDVPTEVPTTAAVFLVLRRLRWPLVIVLGVFAISVFGFTLIPGVDDQGNPYRMSAFDAFYVMAYTAPTIGFGETPYAFTVAQRMWMTVCIFMSVTIWAYALGATFAMLQEPGFRKALSMQRFHRRVESMREPFILIAGYGQAGRTLALALDQLGRRMVILDEDPSRIDVLVADQLTADVPSLQGDPRNPGILGLAGLGHPMCEGVMAMTDKDEMNLAVVMSAHLLRPEIPVITRCSQRENVPRLEDFGPQAVINPFDRYGHYLVMALSKPVTYQLASWLLDEPGTPLPKLHCELNHGRWMVAADGRFGAEVTRDLRAAGLEVEVVDPSAGLPDVSEMVGFVAGAESDTTNLSLAAHARLENPDVYLSVRQKAVSTAPLLEAFEPDQVFVATDLVAFETLARVEAPLFWGFIQHVHQQTDEWSAKVLKDMQARLGNYSPTAIKLVLDGRGAPAVCRWLDKGNTLTLGQLLSDPDDRDQPIDVYPSVLVRDGLTQFVPDLRTPLQVGDELGLLVRTRGNTSLSHNVFHDEAVEYLATGESVPSTWLWRQFRDRRRNRA